VTGWKQKMGPMNRTNGRIRPLPPERGIDSAPHPKGIAGGLMRLIPSVSSAALNAPGSEGDRRSVCMAKDKGRASTRPKFLVGPKVFSPGEIPHLF